jgi:hypothetical protein
MALTDNLISYWKFDESSGNAADSVNDNDGVLTNTTYTTGKINNGVSFGSSPAIKIAEVDSLDTASAMTISFWVNFSDVTSLYQILAARWSWSSPHSNQRSWRIFFNLGSTNNLEFLVSPNGTTESDSLVASSLGLSTSTWYHFVCRYDGSTQKIYLNGVEKATRDYSGGIFACTTAVPMYLGAWSSDGSTIVGNAPASGTLMDEVGIWSRALTGTEITELYNSGDGLAYPFGGGAVILQPNLLTLGVG